MIVIYEGKGGTGVAGRHTSAFPLLTGENDFDVGRAGPEEVGNGHGNHSPGKSGPGKYTVFCGDFASFRFCG